MRIVSANFNNRRSPQRWLIRDHNQSPEQAVAVVGVIAYNIAFCPSTTYEAGFGCSTVAFCERAEGMDNPVVPAGAVRLKFRGFSFYGPDDEEVPACKTLVLMPDGAMYGLLEDEKEVGTARWESRRTPELEATA